MDAGGAYAGQRRLRAIVGISGGVYLSWWFAVEALLPGAFNPLAGRAEVVAVCWMLLGASYRSRFVNTHLSTLFTAWACLLVAHYCYLIIGNHGDPTWWVGAFVTFAACSMCLQSRLEVAIFSLFALASVVLAAAVEGQLQHSIYVPGLATILLLANVTKRSQTIAHEAARQAEQAASESRLADEQRFQLAAIVESSGDAIIGTSLGGLIQSWNQGADRLFGYRASEVVGRPITVLAPQERQTESVDLEEGPPSGEATAPFEAVRRHKDGTNIDVSLTVSPIRDSRGALVGESTTARDISRWKRAEAEVLRAREEAVSANRELEAFNYSVAHDLRAPLRGIDGFSHALFEDYGDVLDDEGRHYLRRVREGAQHMGRLIDSLLALGRVTRVSLLRQPVDLSELARRAVERLRESQPDRVVEVVVADGLTELGDTTLLSAAIDNLLSNAWKFTRHQPNARIEFGYAAAEGGHAAYFVRDNGAGFDMAFATRLFGVFQRLHAPGEFEGNGVGLATVQRIIRRHGGQVWAEGTVGHGASFHFTIGDDGDASRPR